MNGTDELRWFARMTFGLVTASAVGAIVLVGWAAVKVLLR